MKTESVQSKKCKKCGASNSMKTYAGRHYTDCYIRYRRCKKCRATDHVMVKTAS